LIVVKPKVFLRKKCSLDFAPKPSNETTASSVRSG
jgi:hypothetical protein